MLAILNEIHSSDAFDDNTSFSAEVIINSIDYKFIVSICVWNDISSQLNIVSKSLQSIKMSLAGTIVSLEQALKYLHNYKNEKFGTVLKEAGEIAEQNGIDINFVSRGRKLRKEGKTIDPKNAFKKNFFDFPIDVAIHSITERFAALTEFENNFSFLCEFDDIKERNKSGELLKSCINLEKLLSRNGKSDIDGEELSHELLYVAALCRKVKVKHIVDVLNAIRSHEMEHMLPNAMIAYRILATLPVAVATGERSFSKLRIIKNYLRSTMGQDSLNSLAALSIEHEGANVLDYDDIRPNA